VRVALGVSAGIAAYKACEIVRGLDRAGLEVQVVLTRNAARFVTPLTLQTLSRRRVLRDTFDLHHPDSVQHVDLGRDLAVLAIAPATANVLSKLAHGAADDVLTTLHLATTAPLVLAPAMNTRMWLHPATQGSVAVLMGRGARVVGPDRGWLAENEVGWGRMAEPAAVVEAVLAAAAVGRQLAGRRVVVTAGPTREALDPVRFLSNRSSGKMGYALAEAAARRGAEVVLVSGPVSLSPPHGVRVVRVDTAAQMRDAVLRERDGAHAVLMAAAVADHAPTASPTKIKKTGGGMAVALEPAPDILAELGASKGGLLLVGFAAETSDLVARARDKLERKGVDFIVANDVSAPGVGMEADDNAVVILSRDGGVLEVPRASKTVIAGAILDHVFGSPS
jgi:phosphopantothenoylcysteine decarboxylase/phosphopantothenate--cysteine ligase